MRKNRINVVKREVLHQLDGIRYSPLMRKKVHDALMLLENNEITHFIFEGSIFLSKSPKSQKKLRICK